MYKKCLVSDLFSLNTNYISVNSEYYDDDYDGGGGGGNRRNKTSIHY
jgi:hypothetical protein